MAAARNNVDITLADSAYEGRASKACVDTAARLHLRRGREASRWRNKAAIAAQQMAHQKKKYCRPSSTRQRSRGEGGIADAGKRWVVKNSRSDLFRKNGKNGSIKMA